MSTDTRLSARGLQVQTHQDALNAWSFARLRAPTELAGLVDSYCDYSETTGGFSTRRELPHAEGVLIINLAAAVRITGGDGRAITLQAGQAFVAGVHLRPAWSHSVGSQSGMQVQLPLSSLRRLLGLPMHQLLDQVLSLDELLGPGLQGQLDRLVAAESLHDRVQALDQILLTRLRHSPALDRRQLAGLQLLREQPGLDICAIAEQLNLSRKHFAERVQDAIGVGPRSYRRLLRFQQAHRALTSAGSEPDWARLACSAGYYDQSHLIREFREFAGMTPGECHRRTLGDGGGLVEQ